MTAKELQKRNNKAENLRVLQAETGQFFCESEKGKILYQVTLTDDEASCTCGDFAKNSRKDSNFRCKHILSVMNSCDSVIDGAFFPHPDFQVPEEKMGHHAREYMVVPSRKFAHFVMVHAQFGFGFLETLLDRPAQTAEPYKRF